MANVIEFLIVGRTPLGGALRAGLIGVAATAIGNLLFSGFWAPLGLGAVVVVAMLPVWPMRCRGATILNRRGCRPRRAKCRG